MNRLVVWLTFICLARAFTTLDWRLQNAVISGAEYQNSLQSFSFRGRGSKSVQSCQASIPKTSCDVYYSEFIGDQTSWSFHAFLSPAIPVSGTQFGQSLFSNDDVTLIGSPGSHSLGGAVGMAYLFRGEWSMWTQQQSLTPDDRVDSSYGSDFGISVSMDDSFALISAPSDNDFGSSVGSVYSFISYPPHGTLSLQQKLHPRDAIVDQVFGTTLSLSDNIAVIGSPGVCTCPEYKGAVYVFAADSCTGLWSQQQKLTVDTSGNKVGQIVSMYDKSIVVGVSTEDYGLKSGVGAVYVFRQRANGRYSIQQKLLQSATGGEQNDFFGNSLSLYGTTLLVSGAFSSSVDGLIYVFTWDGGRWTSMQQLSAPPVYGTGNHLSNPHVYGMNAFASDDQWNAYYFSADYNWSCLVISLGDHFGDGWGGAKLRVAAPDGSSDSYAPYCTSRNPFVFRYCPVLPTDAGTYSLNIPRAMEAPFYWEMYWTVVDEKSGNSFAGDYSTELSFHFDSSTLSFSLLSSQRLLANSSCHLCPDKGPNKPKPKPKPTTIISPVTKPAPASSDHCRLAHRVVPAPAAEKLVPIDAHTEQEPTPSQPHPQPLPRTFRSLQQTTSAPSKVPTSWPTLNNSDVSDWHWLSLQDSSANGWFRADGKGTSYYISDTEGRDLVSSGTLCGDRFGYRCWQPLWDGTYVLRVGGALDADADNHIWSFCGKTGGAQVQLVFQISDGTCTPIVSFSKNQYCSENGIKTRFRGRLVLRGMDNDTVLTANDMLLLDQTIASLSTLLKASDVHVDDVTFSGVLNGHVVTFTVTVPSSSGFDGRDFEELESLTQTLTSSLDNGLHNHHFVTALTDSSDTSITDSGTLLGVTSVHLIDISLLALDFTSTPKDILLTNSDTMMTASEYPPHTIELNVMPSAWTSSLFLNAFTFASFLVLVILILAVIINSIGTKYQNNVKDDVSMDESAGEGDSTRSMYLDTSHAAFIAHQESPPHAPRVSECYCCTNRV